MMHIRLRRLLVNAALVVTCSPACAPRFVARVNRCPDPRALTRGFVELLATVRYLSDDALEGRLAGSPGEQCAGDYIAARFQQLGLRGAGPDGSYFQNVPLASIVNPVRPVTAV